MMPNKPLPPDSPSYAAQAFRAKEKWHRRQARLSFKRKLEILEELRLRGKLIVRFEE